MSLVCSATVLAGADLAGEIDGVAVDDGLGHARTNFDATDGHSEILLFM